MSQNRISIRATPCKDDPVEVQIIGNAFLDVLEARDISKTGVAVFVPHRFAGSKIDEEVQVVITLPRETPFLAKGMIVHMTKVGQDFFGVRFTKIEASHRKKIANYVASA